MAEKQRVEDNGMRRKGAKTTSSYSPDLTTPPPPLCTRGWMQCRSCYPSMVDCKSFSLFNVEGGEIELARARTFLACLLSSSCCLFFCEHQSTPSRIIPKKRLGMRVVSVLLEATIFSYFSHSSLFSHPRSLSLSPRPLYLACLRISCSQIVSRLATWKNDGQRVSL